MKLIRNKKIGTSILNVVLVMVVAVVLVACHDEDDVDFVAPQITIDSPTPGSNVTSLLVLISGTVSSDVTLVELTVKQDINDVGTTITATLVGTSFSGNVTLLPGINYISAMARDAIGNRNTITFELHYPQLSLTDGHAAALVIGQADFTSNAANRGSTPSANTLSGVQGALFENGNTILYVPDSGNNRVLGFNAIPTVLDTSANFVIGQIDFTTVSAGTSATQLTAPSSIFTTTDKTFVADTGNNRVLIWNSLVTSGTVNADNVIGQLDLTSAATSCSSSTLSGPTSVFVVNDKVVVLDKGNHRVLIWNAIPTMDGVAADVVIGQVGASAMDTCAANDSDGNGVTDALTASTLNNPGGIWTDGTRLLIADTDNNRVLVWDTFPTANGEAATRVIGQANMTSSAVPAPPTQSSLNSPRSVASNGNQIVVADSGNTRVLIFNTFPATDGEPAANVIGQDNFVTTGTGTTDTRMTSYDSVYVDRTRLFVVDGNRILMFVNP